MQYILVLFTAGLTCQAYQEVDANGIVTRYCDLTGNTLTLPNETESHVIDANPARPGWGL